MSVVLFQGSGETALMRAAQEGHLEICRFLIDTGFVLFQYRGLTALMWAASGGHLEICILLIDTGCKIDITTPGWGETALMRAARLGHLEICRLLIDRRCKIDITDNDGYTALHAAAERGYLQTTRCLVEQGGANPLVKTHEGQTPYDLAAECMQGQYKEVMEYLQTVMSEKSPGDTAGQEREDVVSYEEMAFGDPLIRMIMLTMPTTSIDILFTVGNPVEIEQKNRSSLLEKVMNVLSVLVLRVSVTVLRLVGDGAQGVGEGAKGVGDGAEVIGAKVVGDGDK
ncbi:fibronectin type 3 and ankyrin repeat domains 1 protein-like [Mytilus trossulus]|uniref:fibronectin type 3 and ankyrin repeat domains 1 protein-like n=1 Tax=Mytilus trossulus TaxID=6551 RepID=UPI0030075D96